VPIAIVDTDQVLSTKGAAMPEFRATITIDRPPDEVFRYLADPHNMTVWQAGLESIDADWEAEPKVGDRARGTVKIAGKKIRWETETTEVQRPELISFRSVKSPFPFEMSYTLADRNGSTEVANHGSTQSTKGFFGKLAEPLVTRMYERDVTSNLANLKAILEAT
jgi:uncharacterized protein YndB with AHSA1/START domain